MNGDDEAPLREGGNGTGAETNLQRLLTHLPADSLAAKLVAAHQAENRSGEALRQVLQTRLNELRAAYDRAD